MKKPMYYFVDFRGKTQSWKRRKDAPLFGFFIKSSPELITPLAGQKPRIDFGK